MDRTVKDTPLTAAAVDQAEPRHLHFDRRTRTWLAHAANGILLPYRDGPGLPSGDLNGAGEVAA